jgi:hypothetical protein
VVEAPNVNIDCDGAVVKTTLLGAPKVNNGFAAAKSGLGTRLTMVDVVLAPNWNSGLAVPTVVASAPNVNTGFDATGALESALTSAALALKVNCGLATAATAIGGGARTGVENLIANGTLPLPLLQLLLVFASILFAPERLIGFWVLFSVVRGFCMGKLDPNENAGCAAKLKVDAGVNAAADVAVVVATGVAASKGADGVAMKAVAAFVVALAVAGIDAEETGENGYAAPKVEAAPTEPIKTG